MFSFDLQRFAVYKVIPSASTPSGAAVQDPIQHFAVSDKTVTVYNRDFEGATDAVNGKNGMVPAPTVNDKDKFLKGDGTWQTVRAGDINVIEDIRLNGTSLPVTNKSVDITFSVPAATATTEGVVKIGSGLTITDGVLSAEQTPSYVAATSSTDGLMSAADKSKLDGLTSYTLPTAGTSVKGGVKVGDGLSMVGEVLNVTLQPESYTLPTASTSTKGGIIVGDGLSMNGDTLNASTYTLPTASASTKGGVIIGNGLQMDGDTLNVTLQGGSTGGGYIISSAVSSVEGGFWQDTFNNVPVLKLRHGGYEYNFKYDNLTYLGGTSVSPVTATPDTYVLGTDSVSTEGGVWYEVNNDVPQLKLHVGNFNYGFNYDRITYKGDNSSLAAYLPLNVSPTADACGNVWTPTGNPTIVDGALYLDGSSYLKASTPTGTVYDYTVDFWFTPSSISHDYYLFGTTNGYNLCVSAASSTVHLVYTVNKNTYQGRIAITSGTRHHIAYVGLSSGNVFVFIDGVLDIASTYPPGIQPFYFLGAGANNGEQPAIGSIDHFRIFRGQALWTSDFTPPTAADYT